MLNAHVNTTRPVDAPAPDYETSNWSEAIADYNDRRQYAAHKDIAVQPILGIGATTAVAVGNDEGEYVLTAQPAYVVAVEDIADGVYEVWQPCEGHATTHKVYAQWFGDEVPLAFGLTVPLLLMLAEVIE